MAHQAYAVIDLGFGDSGKGTIVDYLVRKTGSNLVIRFNGGAQAGHNVVTPDGRHHCFSQFGSGTFVEGVRTLLTKDVAIHPLALVKEASRLKEAGVSDAMERLIVDEGCPVITPYHQALNCLKELSRGAGAHGSCGVGYGETVSHMRSTNSKYGYFIAWNLKHPSTSHLEEIRLELLREAEALYRPTSALDTWGKWYDLLSDKENSAVISQMFHEVGKKLDFACSENDEAFEYVQNAKTPIFEGAQGVLIDEKWGFAPYNTWSDVTGSRIYDQFGLHPGDGSITTIGVVRAFPTRHGAGPFPTEFKEADHNDGTQIANIVDHNVHNKWQGHLRTGYFDGVLNRYAIQACRINNFPISALAVTHLDQLKGLKLWRHCELYDIDDLKPVDAEMLMWANDYDRTDMASRVKPFYVETEPDEHNVMRHIESYADVPVVIKSTGPTASDKVSLL
jgi:adenylosuccinate synthase